MNSNIIIFDIEGKMAHFRKYYTNSSSLSYNFPPRTTIAGIIAAILGLERDSYYDILDREHCDIALSVRSQTRHMMQTINYVRTKEAKEFNGSYGHTQTPLEIILPGIEQSVLKYRVYFRHKDELMMTKLYNMLIHSKSVYPLYMGLSEFTAMAKYVASIEKDMIVEITPGSDIDLSSVCNIDYIVNYGLNFISSKGETLQYIKERMPIEFNPNRELKTYGCYIFERNHNSIRVKLNVPSYRVKYKGIEENILFM